LQAGDCAESFAECTPAHALAKESVLAGLAGQLSAPVGLPVIQIGRIAGQFAKPRSVPADGSGWQLLPAFRGHIINGAEPFVGVRRHDPNRMLRAYDAALTVGRALAEWPKWEQVMAADPVAPEILAGLARNEALTRPRPGHTDLAGMQKYSFDEARPVLERASARETAAREALGAATGAPCRCAPP
jgi:hypothetical protein